MLASRTRLEISSRSWGAKVGVFWLVGDYVDVVPGRDFGGEGELVEVLAGEDGGVFQLLDGGGLKLGGAACFGVGVVGPCGRERGAEAPAGGDGHAGLDGDFLHGDVGGVEHELFPLEDGDLVVGAMGDDAVEMGVEGGDAFGDGDVELVEVGVVATPVEGLAVGGEDDAGDVGDGAGGAMVAGDRLGGDEGVGPGLTGRSISAW